MPKEHESVSKEMLMPSGVELPDDPLVQTQSPSEVFLSFTAPPGFTIHKFDDAPPGFTVHRFDEMVDGMPEAVIEPEPVAESAVVEEALVTVAAAGTNGSVRPRLAGVALEAIAATSSSRIIGSLKSRGFYREQARHLGNRARAILPAMVHRANGVTKPARDKLSAIGNDNQPVALLRLSHESYLSLREVRRQRGLAYAVGAAALIATVIYLKSARPKMSVDRTSPEGG